MRRFALPILFTLCGLVAALTALPAAAHPMEPSMSQPSPNTTWRVTERIRGLTGTGEVLPAGEKIYLADPPPRDLVEQGVLVAVGDEVDASLETENLRALLEEARADRNRALRDRDAAQVRVAALDAQVRADGETIGALKAELAAARDGRAIADAEVQRLTAELDRRPPAPTVAERLEQVHPKTLLAAINERRVAQAMEPFGGAGATERARAWVLAAAPDLAEQIAQQRG